MCLANLFSALHVSIKFESMTWRCNFIIVGGGISSSIEARKAYVFLRAQEKGNRSIHRIYLQLQGTVYHDSQPRLFSMLHSSLNDKQNRNAIFYQYFNNIVVVTVSFIKSL